MLNRLHSFHSHRSVVKRTNFPKTIIRLTDDIVRVHTEKENKLFRKKCCEHSLLLFIQMCANRYLFDKRSKSIRESIARHTLFAVPLLMLLLLTLLK